MKRRLSKRYRAVHQSGVYHIKKRPYILPLLGLLLGGLMVAVGFYARGSAQSFRPSDSHVVFLFDSGKKQTIDTKAATVGELVHRLPLHLIPQDVVEPAANTPIVEDNFRINIYHARPVTVVDGTTKTVTLTAQKSARVVAEGAGLKIKPEDIASFQEGSLAENVIGEKVVVGRATPIMLNLYGAEIPTYTQATNMAGFLREKHIKLDNGETVKPDLDAPISANMQVFILAKGSHVETDEVPVPAPTQVVADASLSFGTTVTRQAGVPGKQAVTYLITVQNDGQTSKKVIQQAIVQAPVPQIIARGTTIDINGDKTSIMAAAGISSGDFAYANFIISHESGWRPTAANSSGAYGLCQALPGSKMASAGGDWSTNPITQLRWCSGYAARSYGGWGAAYNHWLSYRSW